jgi:hypothetical protein
MPLRAITFESRLEHLRQTRAWRIFAESRKRFGPERIAIYATECRIPPCSIIRGMAIIPVTRTNKNDLRTIPTE